MTLTAILFDTETTNKDEPEIIESSYAEVFLTGKSDPAGIGSIGQPVTQRYMPNTPIALGAMATHHIMEEDLANEPNSSTFKFPDVTYVIGHKIDFDMGAVDNTTGMSHEHIKRIDTLPMAQKLWPDCDSHTVSALTYYFYRDEAREILKNAHSAEADILLTARILDKILQATNIRDFEALYEFSEQARIPEKMAFGKHVGVAIKDLPADYVSWVLKQPDFDPFVIKAIHQCREQKLAEAAGESVAAEVVQATPPAPFGGFKRRSAKP